MLNNIPPKKRTVTSDLIISLAVVILAAMVIRGVVEYDYLTSNLLAAIDKRADESADDIASVLQVPLFFMNYEEVHRIADVYISSGRLAGARIISSEKGLLIDKPFAGESVLQTRKRSVLYQGRELGSVELWFDDRGLRDARRELIEKLIILSVLTVAGGFVFFYIIVKRLLTSPLSRLLLRIEDISRGQLRGDLPSVPQEDLNSIMSAMNKMSGELENTTSHLRESRARYQTLVDNLPLGVNLIDSDYHIVMSNATMGKWFSKEHSLFIGQHCFREFEKRDQCCSHCPGDISMKTGSFAMTETEGVRDDGSHFAVRISTVPLLEQGNASGFIEVVEDISALRKVHDEKLKVEEQLRQTQKMEAIGTLAGGIAHDFNNILSVILGYTEMAQVMSDKGGKLSQCLEYVSEAGLRARDLVKQILTFSRKAEHQKMPLQLTPMVKEDLKLLRSTIPTTIEIRQNLAATTSVLADPTQMHQVIMNLCTNAYQSMEQTGGVLAVSLKELVIRQEPFPGEDLSPGRYVVLAVSDTGCGMDDDTKAKIFEPYFTTKALGKGTGLGLAVVHGIVKDHQGRISVYSEPGTGSTFKVYLPVMEEASTALLPLQQEEAAKGSGELIIFVDDEERIRCMAKDYLESNGYRVHALSSGVAALELFAKDPQAYAMLITDMSMPELNGSELARKVLALRPELPVILCTGYSSLIDREGAVQMGIRDYIEKPVVMSHLLGKIKKALSRS